jgi:hypothetical protein
MKKLTMILLGIALFSMTAWSAADVDELSGSLLAQLEEASYGIARSGALVDRLWDLELDIEGQGQKGATLTRLFQLRDLILGPGSQSFAYKLSVLEWHVLKKQSSGPIIRRLAALEAAFLGQTRIGEGSVRERVTKLMLASFDQAEPQTKQVILRQWTPVSIELLTTLDSGKLSGMQPVLYRVVQDVIYDGQLLVPAGALGQGKVVKVGSAGYFGKPGYFEVDFGTITAIDGSEVVVHPRKALWQKDDDPLRLAAGLSMGGLLISGKFWGAALGLLVRGNQLVVPQGTLIELEVAQPCEVTALVLDK